MASVGLGLAGGLISGILESDAADSANEAMQRGGVDATSRINRAYGESKHLYDPYIQAGSVATRRLRDLLDKDTGTSFAEFQTSPEFAGILEEGMKAIRRSASARGGSLSGGTLKALERFGVQETGRQYGQYKQGQLSERGQQIAGWQGLVNPGLNAANQLTGLNMNTAGQLNEIGLGMSSSEAANKIKQGQIVGNMVSSIGKTAGGYLAEQDQEKRFNDWYNKLQKLRS